MSQGLIQGSMREAPLPDIIQLVAQGGKSGCFHVIDEPKRAKIFLKDGKLAHAVSHDAEGLDAVYEVALWLDGRYTFEEGDFGVETSITRSNASVLMEMHRRMDEWRVISQKIASLDLHPVSTLLPGEQVRGVHPKQARMLSFLTGWYSIQELAQVLKKPVLNVAKDLYDLVMTGFVVMKGVRSGKAPEIPAEFQPKASHAPKGPLPPGSNTVTAGAPQSFTNVPTSSDSPHSGILTAPPRKAPDVSQDEPTVVAQEIDMPEKPVPARSAPPATPEPPRLPRISPPQVPKPATQPMPQIALPQVTMPSVSLPSVPLPSVPAPPTATSPVPIPLPQVTLPQVTLPQPPSAAQATGQLPIVPPVPKVPAVPTSSQALDLAYFDPVRIQKLTLFAQRIAATAEKALPGSLQPMVETCLVDTMRQLNEGVGPDAVKNMAVYISKKAVEAGCDGNTVKLLNAQLKSLFGKPS